MHMVSCCFFLMSVGAVYLWLYAHMYLCISIFICHSVSALLSLFPFKCRSCIYFLCTDEFPVLYTKEKRSVGRACILFMSLSRKCFTIERYEWKREWDYFFSFLSLLSTVFCLIFPVMYFLFSPFSPITLQTPVPITNVLNVIYSACIVSPFFTACFLYSNPFLFFFFKQLIAVLNTANSFMQFGLVSLPFIWPLLMALRISKSTTQGSRTNINSPKSVVRQWLKEVLEEGLADKILRGWLEGWGQMVNVG